MLYIIAVYGCFLQCLANLFNICFLQETWFPRVDQDVRMLLKTFTRMPLPVAGWQSSKTCCFHLLCTLRIEDAHIARYVPPCMRQRVVQTAFTDRSPNAIILHAGNFHHRAHANHEYLGPGF